MTKEKVKAARFSITSNSTLVPVKLIIGIPMGSVAVLSEAIHTDMKGVAPDCTC